MPSDPRAAQARVLHADGLRADGLAASYRQRRDRLVRALHKEDPQLWTKAELARQVGCSDGLIRAILQREDGDSDGVLG